MSDIKDTYENLDLVPINNNTVDIAQKILDEDDIDTVKKYIQMFNVNQSKKDVMRVMKLGSLLDKVSDQMIERFEKRPGEFSNSDLLSYLQVTQSAMEKANKSLNLVDETPAISLQQNNQVNINIGSGLDQESKNRVISVIQNILNRSASEDVREDSNPVKENDVVEVSDFSESNDENVSDKPKKKRGRPKKEVLRDVRDE